MRHGMQWFIHLFHKHVLDSLSILLSVLPNWSFPHGDELLTFTVLCASSCWLYKWARNPIRRSNVLAFFVSCWLPHSALSFCILHVQIQIHVELLFTHTALILMVVHSILLPGNDSSCPMPAYPSLNPTYWVSQSCSLTTCFPFKLTLCGANLSLKSCIQVWLIIPQL